MTSNDAFYISREDPPSKQAILRAALKLFVRDGYSATHIRAIAHEAGYTNPALFKYFASKEKLALHLFERCYQHYAYAFRAATQAGHPFEENLEAVLNQFCSKLDENPRAFLFVQDHLREFWPLVSPSLRRLSMITQLDHLLVHGLAEGVVREDVPRNMMIAALVGFLVQFARMFHFGEFEGLASDRLGEIRIVAGSMLMR